MSKLRWLLLLPVLIALPALRWAPAQPVSPPLRANEAKCMVGQDGMTIVCKVGEAVPKPYLRRVFTAENSTNVALTVVGILGIIVAVWTLAKIHRQTKEMTRQRILMEGSLDVVKRQTSLMEKQATHVEAQTSILKDSVDAAQKSADAAKTSADIAAGVSLPKLVVHELKSDTIGMPDPNVFFQFPKVKITIKNYGQTPAFLKWWALCFTCEDLPDAPIYSGPATGMVLDKIVVQPNETYTFPPTPLRRQEFSIEDAMAVVTRQKIFRVYGYVCYGDIFGNPLKRFKFCETVLNIFGGYEVCDWWEGLASQNYVGTELYPNESPTSHPADELSGD